MSVQSAVTDFVFIGRWPRARTEMVCSQVWSGLDCELAPLSLKLRVWKRAEGPLRVGNEVLPQVEESLSQVRWEQSGRLTDAASAVIVYSGVDAVTSYFGKETPEHESECVKY